MSQSYRPSLVLRPLVAVALWLVASLASAQELTVPVVDPTGPVAVLVELTETPAAVAYGNALQGRAAGGDGLQQAAIDAGESQMSAVLAEQQRVVPQLLDAAPAAAELFRVQRALNAVALRVEPDAIAALRAVPGVRRVTVMELEYPTNSTSVPFLGTPELWADTLGLGLAADGTGITIGVIDTGVDYQHATFGGTGALADYQANDRTVAPDAFFPTARVVGGYDFAGDAYTGGNAPVPDNDPMDCNGHGTHVAGTAAGSGVNADGTPYTGPFTPAADYGALRVGPGTAPKALVYALRVFGCGGGTNLTLQAIDWAMDPNGDTDLSDHLDVINMSLGSAFGSAFSGTAIAADNAALAGVIVVTSAGNSGDTYFIGGSPGSGDRVIATAASADSGLPGPGVRVNAPAAIAGNYVAGTASFGGAPPASGTTGNVVIGEDASDAAGPLTTDGCSPLTNAAAVAGNIALIDRGTCGFAVKAKTAQDAGAIAVVIANSSAGAFGNMGGTDPTVTIPAVMVTFADGNTFKANIASLNVTLFPASDTIASFSSRGPRRSFPHGTSPRLKPDVTAPGVAITSAQTGVTCTGAAGSAGCQVTSASGYLADNQPLVLQGTSMAAPHVAGIMALLRQLHPTWSVEELKALVVNGSLADVTVFPGGGGARFGGGRVGAGRVDPPASAVSSVLAFDADGGGLVSLSFDGEVVGTATRTKRLRIVNLGATAASFDLAIDTVVDAPGVSFALPGGSSLTVAAGDSVEIDVEMTADAAAMDHTRDLTVAATQAAPAPIGALGSLNRHWLTEETGYVTLSQGGDVKLRVPVYAEVHPASRMSAPPTIATGGAATGSTTIPLSGVDVCTGTLGAGPSCTGSFSTDEVSLVTPFELHVASPLDPLNAPYSGDLQYAGVAFSTASDLVLFGLSTHGNWSTPTDTTFNVCVDANEDGVYDRIVFHSNPGTLAGAVFGANPPPSAQDSFVTGVFNTGTNSVSIGGNGLYVNRISAAGADTRLFLNRALFLAATPAQLGMTAGDTTFRYKVVVCPGGAPLCGRSTTGDRCSPAGGYYDQASGPYFWNSAAQGLDFGGGNLFFDLDGASLPVTWNTANMTTNGSLGALLLHHHNEVGQQAEVVLLEGGASADLALSKAVDVPAPEVGSTVTLTVTVTNHGPDAATGVVVEEPLAPGLTWVADNSAGLYDPSTGLWTVGNLGVTDSATLHVVATVDRSGEQCSLARIAAGTPLDTDPSDDTAQVCLSAPQNADLAATIALTSPGSPHVEVGQPLSYTVTLTNLAGPTAETAYDVETTLTFPGFASVAVTGATPTAGSFDAGTGIWSIASLAPGVSQTLQVTITTPPTPPDVLTAQVVAAAEQNDPDTTNNLDSVSVGLGGFFYSLAPCRLVDTRLADGPYGGPALAPGLSRVVAADAGGCGIPADARAVALNVTVVNAEAAGHLTVSEAGIGATDTSVLNFAAGQTRANNTVVELDGSGQFTVTNASAGSSHVVVDVSGYFR